MLGSLFNAAADLRSYIMTAFAATLQLAAPQD